MRFAEAVVFDWDGTLLDSKAAIIACYREATTEVLGRPFPSTEEELHRILPMQARESFGSLSDDPRQVDALIAAYHRCYLRRSAIDVRPFPGTLETLQELKDRGVRVGVATSKGRERVDSDVARFGFTDLVGVYVTAREAPERKPHPGAVLEALRRLGVEPASTLYVGDGPQDVIAGRRAGAVTVAAAYGFHGQDELVAEGPAHVIHAVEEVLDLLTGPGADR